MLCMNNLTGVYLIIIPCVKALIRGWGGDGGWVGVGVHSEKAGA